MTFCSTCGSSITDGSHFCSSCGSKLQGDTTGHRRPSAESIAINERRLLQALRDATLGEYEIQGEIGRGGMAVVYLAHDVGLNRKVAVKVMSPALTLMVDGIQERFKREAQTAAALSHPHIIPVYAVREAHDLVFFVMKYIVGRSLESVIKEVGPMPIPVTQTILNQAGGALAHAHKRGIVHRDVKPGNIMLDEDGWVIVADFGIAKVAEAEALTMTGGVVGTPAYMSPEQCSGGELTGAADQYSLGIVAYEMLAGRKPFDSGTMVNLIYDHCHTPPPPLLEARPDCPPELAAVITRMIEKSPADRFPSVAEAVAATGFATESSQEAARTHMSTLAKVTETDKLLHKFKVTGSPAPPARAVSFPPSTPSTPMPQADDAPATRRGVPVWAWAVPLVGVTGAALWFAMGRSEGPSPQEAGPAVTAQAPPVAALDVQPLTATLRVGETLALDAIARGPDGAEVTGVSLTWNTNPAGIVDITRAGVVTARAPGTAQVTAQTAAASASIVVTVTRPRLTATPTTTRLAVTAVQLAPTALDLQVGDRARVAATMTDRTGTPLSNRRVDWSTSDAGVVQVDANGTVTALAPGSANVRAASEGIVGQTVVRVAAMPVASVTVTPDQVTLEERATTRLVATLRDPQQRELTDRVVTWESSDPEVARVGTGGEVTAVATGTARITATAGGRSGSATIAVAAVTPRLVTPPRNDRAEIEGVLEAYRQAIASTSVTQIRAVYPTMTSDQETSWNGFFRSVSDFAPEFDVADIVIDGTTATARINAVYRYRTNQDQARDLQLVVHLRRMTDGWQIATVR